MDNLNVIVDEQLPIYQDFKSLKAEGLAYIQQHSGLEWTNFNASDPGVTILDQVCYALTELGYCNDFELGDILTNKNGILQIDNQFYLPQDILTTSPVTINDYRKYIIDGINGVNNVVITVAQNMIYNAVYQVYLLIDPSAKNIDVDNICKATFFYLNKCRNIAEVFLMPAPLKPFTNSASATITIDDKGNLNAIWVAIQNTIKNYIFPQVVQSGYDQMVSAGNTVNDVFNGPLLQNGWINDNLLADKRNKLSKTELINLIKNVSGVVAVSDLILQDARETTDDEILTINLSPVWIVKGEKLNTSSDFTSNLNLAKPLPSANGIHLGAAVNIQTKLAQGVFRDINSYYSIQNTFPEIFAVGADSVTSNASDFQIAISRQLKGYLTLFDQVLANQFSQLANIDKLFSFKNSTSGTPSDVDEFYAVQDAFEKANLEYPVPYEVFAPTYFYQSLYDVPHIKPLLKDNDTFKFSSEIETDAQLEIDSWDAYKHDPYNPYIRGLMEFMEDDHTNVLRRNNILDHLLARHGESPYIIDALIDGSVYTGDTLKDKVVFKSLYLQNLGLLSYYRQKANNFIGANNILPLPKDKSARPDAQAFANYTNDFIFKSEEVDQAEKLTPQHFINYSAIELKLGLLLGLKPLYHTFIANNALNDKIETLDLQLAQWLIEQRRGLIFIETWLLGQYYEAELLLNTNNGPVLYLTITQKVSYAQVVIMERFFNNNIYTNPQSDQDKKQVTIEGNTYSAERNSIKPKVGATYRFSFKMSGTEANPTPVFNSQVVLILPRFIYSPAFENRLSLFLQNTMPTQVTYEYHFVNSSYLENIITAYVTWHNSLMHHTGNNSDDKTHLKNSGDLAALITSIKTGTNE